jgi:hypothetical protein
MQLRYLQTLTQVSNERTSVIVFPMPTDLASLFGREPKSTG